MRVPHARSPAALLVPGQPLVLANVADGAEGFVLADLARAVAAGKDAPATSLLVVCRDGARMAQLARALAFFAPEIAVTEFPAWDCQPYDRASPLPGIVAQRMTSLARLARLKGGERASMALTTVNAIVQRVPARAVVSTQAFSATPGNMLAMDGIVAWLELNGYTRASTVREAGEYAVRGGLIDLFPPGRPDPVRLDFFGDTLESIRSFDPETQRSTDQLHALDLVPVAEFQLTAETIRRFRTGYVKAFGAAQGDDLLYQAVSEGRRYPGIEHWLPLFHDRLDTLLDYLPGTPVILEPLAEEAARERFAQIADYYESRTQALAPGAGTPYKPLPPDQLYLTESEWRERLEAGKLARLSPFAAPEGAGSVIEAGTRQGRNFAPERTQPGANVFEAVKAHVEVVQSAGKRAVFALWSEGARDRMSHVLADHGLPNLTLVDDWPTTLALPKPQIALAVLGLEQGFETENLAVIGEQDILGDRLVRPRRAAKRAENFIAEVSSLTAGDLVVHVDHGVGRFVGLKTIEAAGAPHDCLEIHYAGNDKLFLPVENIELLSRYGSEETPVDLDRLGGGAWQARKARMKARILEMAADLIRVAAERHLREAPRFTAAQGLYDEFCAGFPYDETDDQRTAIDAVLDDLASGRPMDRLVCGDVGFGKTEVALRA
ncbi:MAG: transcription-repair coupling factor, partial [Xanthobacteraceae bacterium]|nr:transcription-repair coupling factor [Xanthobacteraceae bacterium]